MLKLSGVSFAYKKDAVLKDISFEAGRGEIVAVLGANAVGKSTLLKIIAGILKAKGQIFLGEKEIRQLSAREISRKIGYLTQANTANAILTVFEVVLLGRMISMPLKIPESELESVWRTINEVRIGHIAERYFFQLSGGQQRMVSIAQTIAREPHILLLDEPTANLDMQNQLEVLELLRAYTQQKQTITIITLHELNMAARYAHKIIMLKDGLLYQYGSPKEVLTEETVREAYGIEAEITYDSRGIPLVNPLHAV